MKNSAFMQGAKATGKHTVGSCVNTRKAGSPAKKPNTLRGHALSLHLRKGWNG